MSGDTRRESGDAPALAVEEHESGVIALWLNRPDSRNALDRGLVAGLGDIGLLSRIEDDPRGSALALAESLGRLDRAAVARTKAIVRSASGLDAALELERAGDASWSGSVEGLGPSAA